VFQDLRSSARRLKARAKSLEAAVLHESVFWKAKEGVDGSAITIIIDCGVSLLLTLMMIKYTHITDVKLFRYASIVAVIDDRTNQRVLPSRRLG
jgi:hypothetical protein